MDYKKDARELIESFDRLAYGSKSRLNEDKFHVKETIKKPKSEEKTVLESLHGLIYGGDEIDVDFKGMEFIKPKENDVRIANASQHAVTIIDHNGVSHQVVSVAYTKRVEVKIGQLEKVIEVLENEIKRLSDRLGDVESRPVWRDY